MGDQGKWKSQTHNEVHNCWDSTVSTLRILRLMDLFPPYSVRKSQKRGSFVNWMFLSSG